MKILHVSELFSPLSETTIYNLIVGLYANGHNCQVFTLRRMLEKERPFDKVTTILLPHKYSFARLIPSIKRRLGLIARQEQLFSLARRQLSDLVQQDRPDIIHAHFGPMGVLVAPIANKYSIPLVVFFGGYDVTRIPLDPRWRKSYTALVKQVSAIICNSHFTEKKLAEIGFDRRMIHKAIGVDVSNLTYSDPVSRFDGRRVECIFIGRLVEVKAPVSLIRAIAIVRNQLLPDYDIHLTIVGDGPLLVDILHEIATLKLNDYVNILGAVPHGKIGALLAKAHIYVQSNQRTSTGEEETLGGSLLEASASGLPVIAVNSGGIPDAVIDGQTGYLAEEGNLQSMAECIRKLVIDTNKWTEFGRAGYQYVHSEFTSSQQVSKTISIYSKLLSSSSNTIPNKIK